MVLRTRSVVAPGSATASMTSVAVMPKERSVTRKDVKKFVDHCVILRAFWIHYQTMFDGSDLKRELLDNTAPKFFRDLNLMLIQHLILQICKLTDPESTMGKRNLTVQFLIKSADFSASPRGLGKLTKIAARMDAFRKRILPARNRFISHLDLDAALGRKSRPCVDCGVAKILARSAGLPGHRVQAVRRCKRDVLSKWRRRNVGCRRGLESPQGKHLFPRPAR